MSHRSLAEYYERRFAEQRNKDANPAPPVGPAGLDWLQQQIHEIGWLQQTGQLASDNWLEQQVRAGNMRRCFTLEDGEHFQWIGAGPPPMPHEIPCARPAIDPENRKIALLIATRDAVLREPLGRAYRAWLGEAKFVRLCEIEVDEFLRGADSLQERQTPEPDPPAGAPTK